MSVTETPTTTPNPEQLVDLLLNRRRPKDPACAVLLIGKHHDPAIGALIAMTLTGDNDYPSRAETVARLAHAWGTALVKARTGQYPSTTEAVHSGATRLSVYLAAALLTRFTEVHPDTEGDGRLSEHLTTLTRLLGKPVTDQGTLFEQGSALHRHLTVCGYTEPSLIAVHTLAKFAIKSGGEQTAAAGKLATDVVRSLPAYGYGEQVKTWLRSAPLPVLAG